MMIFSPNSCIETTHAGRRPRVLRVAALVVVAGFLSWGAGCANIMTQPETIVATSGREVRTNAWESAEKLVAILDEVDADQHPGIAALVEDLRTAAEVVNSGPGGNFEMLDPNVLITENPNYWRASLEMAPGDGTVAALEVLILAAAGEIEHALDLMELLRAGPLMAESLDRVVSHQRNLIRGWRLNPPSLDVNMTHGIEPQERWRPLKTLQANYPDSPTVAMAVLHMRADLAEIELIAEGEDQRMRNKILAAEPRTMETLEERLPMWAAVIKADGEAGDAAKRVADAMSTGNIGVINLSEADFEKMVADFLRIGLPDWALRAVRLKMGEAGMIDQADLESLKMLLPMVVGDEAAGPIVAGLRSGDFPRVSIFPGEADPVARAEVPMDRVVAGHYERRRRDAMATLEMAAPSPEEERNAWLIVAESERMMGNFGQAREALDRHATLSKDRKNFAREDMALAVAMQDEGAVIRAREELRKVDRKMKETHFMRGIAETMLGDYAAAAVAFTNGFDNEFAIPSRRAFSALHAHGVAQLVGDERMADVEQALELVDEGEWIAKLLEGVRGELDAEQLLALAEEGSDSRITGQRCEAHFALAFAPGQTVAGRRMHLEACANTGMIGYIEYDIALAWLRRVAPQDWPVPEGDAPGLRRGMPASVDSARARTVR